jgi:hypothetical protein
MQDKALLDELLAAESEMQVLAALEKRGLMTDKSRWRYVGNMPNNQAIVHAQQSTAAAALLEKYTNAVDAILLRFCKAAGVDPRGAAAPQSMADAIDKYFGDVADQFKNTAKLRSFAEEHIVLYATGSKPRPCLSLYDAGEGQLPQDFPGTFCSLIHGGSGGGSYKGAIPFVQGRFNMGGTGVLPFCSEKHKLQLVVSRVPHEVAKSTDHEWGYTIFCLFPSKQDPSWHYLVGSDGQVLTAGSAAVRLLPKIGGKSGEVCLPRERDVSSGTLIKMFDFQAARSNICGEQFKKLEDYLLRPALPMRIIECRDGYKANVMQVTVWDRLGRWPPDKLEDGFEDGAAITITLANGEMISGEVRVFKAVKGQPDDPTQTGLRALINGQSHARRDAQFFRNKAVGLEHIATSMLVTLDCTELGQDSRNALFMSNRETFREDPLLTELFTKLQKELHDHDGLIDLNRKRYEDKVANAVTDDDGIKALEELLANDPTLASLFGSFASGKVAAPMAATIGTGPKVKGTLAPFKGTDFPTFFHRADLSTTVDVLLPQNGVRRVSFITDVKNNYFSRTKYRGTCHFLGDFQPTFSLFNGRLNFGCKAGKGYALGDKLTVTATITDSKGSGPFTLEITATIVAPIAPNATTPSLPQMPKVPAGPSRPDIEEVANGPDDPPLTVERNLLTDRLQLLLNTNSKLLNDARQTRPPEEVAAVDFVFKYGLALIAMALLDSVTKTADWKTDEPGCRERIQQTATGIARVIVPICLSLPAKIPKLSYV